MIYGSVCHLVLDNNGADYIVLRAHFTLKYWKGNVPSSCGSSWNKMASEVERPAATLEVKAAPIAMPSAKLCTESPIRIIQATGLNPKNQTKQYKMLKHRYI